MQVHTVQYTSTHCTVYKYTLYSIQVHTVQYTSTHCTVYKYILYIYAANDVEVKTINASYFRRKCFWTWVEGVDFATLPITVHSYSIQVHTVHIVQYTSTYCTYMHSIQLQYTGTYCTYSTVYRYILYI